MTDEQRRLITEEEVFRDEIRRSLEQQKPRPSSRQRFWAVLNSSFVLWLLSSVVVSGLAAAYTSYQGAQSERARRQETSRRLDTEIGNRIYHAGVALDVYRSNITGAAATWTYRGIHAAVSTYLNNTVIGGNQDFSAFADYRTRNFPSLLIELSTLLDQGELQGVQRSLAAYQNLGKVSSNQALDVPATREQQLQAVTDAETLLKTGILQPRWTLSLYSP